MNMKVNNKKIAVGEIKMGGVQQSSLVLIGDAEVIRCSSVYDTADDSLIFSKEVPIRPTTPRRRGN